jgi:hypothetical protein
MSAHKKVNYFQIFLDSFRTKKETPNIKIMHQDDHNFRRQRSKTKDSGTSFLAGENIIFKLLCYMTAMSFKLACLGNLMYATDGCDETVLSNIAPCLLNNSNIRRRVKLCCPI